MIIKLFLWNYSKKILNIALVEETRKYSVGTSKQYRLSDDRLIKLRISSQVFCKKIFKKSAKLTGKHLTRVCFHSKRLKTASSVSYQE